MIWNPAKLIALLICFLFWIFIAFVLIGCASVNKVQEKEGWFPVGMNEDAQGFYNSKYNFMDNGRQDPNINTKIYGVQY